jgi:DNA-binding response OmpR family regulator
MRVLLIEDDVMVSSWVKKLLDEDGLRVDVAGTCDDGLQLAELTDHDLIMLDLELPDRSGIAVVQALRRAGRSTPIIVLTARGDHDDAIVALDAGADDYIVKPVPNGVIKARVRAALRRGGAQRMEELRSGELRLDRVRRTVHVGTDPVPLTPREFAVLEHLMLHVDEVVPRSDLLTRVWGITFDPGTNAVDVAVSRLRQKMGDGSARIATVRGVGFTLTSPAHAQR